LYHAPGQKKQIIFSCGSGVAVLTRQNFACRPGTCGLAALYIYVWAGGIGRWKWDTWSPRCTAQHPTYFFKARSRSTSTWLARNLSDAHTRLTFSATCYFSGTTTLVVARKKYLLSCLAAAFPLDTDTWSSLAPSCPADWSVGREASASRRLLYLSPGHVIHPLSSLMLRYSYGQPSLARSLLCRCLVSYFFCYLTQANDRLRIRPVYNPLEVIRTVLDASQCSVIDISR